MEAGANLPGGDAIYLNANGPHHLRSVGDAPPSALVVISAEEESGEMQYGDSVAYRKARILLSLRNAVLGG